MQICRELDIWNFDVNVLSTKYQQDENRAISHFVIEQVTFVIEPDITLIYETHPPPPILVPIPGLQLWDGVGYDKLVGKSKSGDSFVYELPAKWRTIKASTCVLL